MLNSSPEATHTLRSLHVCCAALCCSLTTMQLFLPKPASSWRLFVNRIFQKTVCFSVLPCTFHPHREKRRFVHMAFRLSPFPSAERRTWSPRRGSAVHRAAPPELKAHACTKAVDKDSIMWPPDVLAAVWMTQVSKPKSLHRFTSIWKECTVRQNIYHLKSNFIDKKACLMLCAAQSASELKQFTLLSCI